MKFDPSPTAIWKKYERDRDYKRSIGLYDRVRRNEAFYLGRQWEGLRVQSLDPLIFNVLRAASTCLWPCWSPTMWRYAPSRLTWMRTGGRPRMCSNARLHPRSS